MDKKIMIVCPSMWPNMRNWGETQRMYYLANYLAQKGWKVYTVSPWYESKDGEDKEQLYEAIFGGEPAQTNKAAQVGEQPKENVVRKIRHKVAKVANYVCEKVTGETPFVEVLKKKRWIREYSGKICELITEKEIKLVIVSAPSFSLFGLGKRIKQRCPDTKLVFDYRDPWYLWKKNNLSCFWEKKYLKNADALVGFSKAFTEDMKTKYNLKGKETETIYNGYSPGAWELRKTEEQSSRQQNDKLVITYTGMIYLANQKDNYRNLTELINIVNSVDNVELYLVGVVGQKAKEKRGNVHYIGNVSQSESFEYMVNSDVLISIHDTKDSSQNYIICGKFYDYVKSGRFLWHIGGRNSLMSTLIEKYNLGISCVNEKQDLAESIQLLTERWKKGSLDTEYNEEFVSFFSRDYQNKRYDCFLEKVLNKN